MKSIYRLAAEAIFYGKEDFSCCAISRMSASFQDPDPYRKAYQQAMMPTEFRDVYEWSGEIGDMENPEARDLRVMMLLMFNVARKDLKEERDE